MAKENGSGSQPGTYVVFDANALLAAEIGTAQARTRDEANKVFSDENPGQSENKSLCSFPERQVNLAFDSTLAIEVETKPVITARKVNPRHAKVPAPAPAD